MNFGFGIQGLGFSNLGFKVKGYYKVIATGSQARDDTHTNHQTGSLPLIFQSEAPLGQYCFKGFMKVLWIQACCYCYCYCYCHCHSYSYPYPYSYSYSYPYSYSGSYSYCSCSCSYSYSCSCSCSCSY